MFCKKCGKELKEGTGFCPKCGYKIKVRPQMSSSERRPVRREDHYRYEEPGRASRRINRIPKKHGKNPFVIMAIILGGIISVSFAFAISYTVAGPIVSALGLLPDSTKNNSEAEAVLTEAVDESAESDERLHTDEQKMEEKESVQRGSEVNEPEIKESEVNESKTDAFLKEEYERLFNGWLEQKKSEGLAPCEGANYLAGCVINGKIRLICQLTYEGSAFGEGYILGFDDGTVREKLVGMERCYGHFVTPTGYLSYCGSGGACVFYFYMINLETFEEDAVEVNLETGETVYSLSSSGAGETASEEEALAFARERVGNDFNSFSYNDGECPAPGWPFDSLQWYMRLEDALTYPLNI